MFKHSHKNSKSSDANDFRFIHAQSILNIGLSFYLNFISSCYFLKITFVRLEILVHINTQTQNTDKRLSCRKIKEKCHNLLLSLFIHDGRFQFVEHIII